MKLDRAVLDRVISSGQSELSPEMRQSAEKHISEGNDENEELYQHFGQEHTLREKLAIQKISVEQDGEVRNIEGIVTIQEASDVFEDPTKKDLSTGYIEKDESIEQDRETYEAMNKALLSDGEFNEEDFLKFNDKLRSIFELADRDESFADSLREFLSRFKEYFEASGRFIDLVGEDNALFYQDEGKWFFQLGSVLKSETRENVEEALQVLEENPDQFNADDASRNTLMNGLALLRLLNATGIKVGIGKVVDITLSETQLKNLERVKF